MWAAGFPVGRDRAGLRAKPLRPRLRAVSLTATSWELCSPKVLFVYLFHFLDILKFKNTFSREGEDKPQTGRKF